MHNIKYIQIVKTLIRNVLKHDNGIVRHIYTNNLSLNDEINLLLLLSFFDPASLYNLVNKANSVHSLFLLYLFLVYFLCMFRATMCPSSGETSVFMRHLVLVILCGWLSGRQGEVKWNFTSPCLPDSHTQRITSTKCRINTDVSPDDGHIVARNMQRKYTK